MTVPSIEIFQGITEDLDNVSLRRDRSTGVRSARLSFKTLQAIQGATSFTGQFSKSLRLMDEEGVIEMEPKDSRFIFGGDEGDELQRVEFTVEVHQDDHWERLMRFLERYAAANGMGYQDKS